MTMTRRSTLRFVLLAALVSGGPLCLAGEPPAATPGASPEPSKASPPSPAAPDEAASKVRRSPMTLEAAFAAADRSLWGDGRTWFTTPEYHDLGEYSCDGVWLRANYRKHLDAWDSGLQMTARDVAHGKVEVRVKVSITDPSHNHDKIVTVMLQIRNGEQVVQNAVIGPISVEDNNNDVGKAVTLTLPADALKTDPMTRLRLTVTTQDN